MIPAVLDFLRTLTTPDRLIHLLSTVLYGWLGYVTLAAIVFAETGLLVGFVLPGDSLLFTIGVVAGAGQLNMTIMIVLLIVACLAGDWCAYLFGRRTGPAIFNRPDSRLFKQEHLQRTNAFYAKHGGKTIIYAKFVPVIRTFAPFVAGVANMRYRNFLTFDVFGAIGWVISMTVLGALLGRIPFVQHNFEKFVVLVVLVSLLPVMLHAVQGLRGRKPALQPGD
jgi:membrane-associated protein